MCHIYSKEIAIKTIDNAKKFVQITSQYNEDIDIIKGSKVLDAKSIMGILGLDLRERITILIHTEDQARANDLFDKLENARIR